MLLAHLSNSLCTHEYEGARLGQPSQLPEFTYSKVVRRPHVMKRNPTCSQRIVLDCNVLLGRVEMRRLIS